MSEQKKIVAVFFGGKSSEHEVSCVSASNIIKGINKDLFSVVMVGITKTGKWLLVDSVEAIDDGSWYESKKPVVLTCDEAPFLYVMDGSNEKIVVDVAFPALHGLFGEDGTIQGLFEMCNIPYVGCGVLTSSVSMDKVYTKIVVDTLGIRQAKCVVIKDNELSDMDDCVARVEAKLSYPVFVKPSQAGSSVGVSKAKTQDALKEALVVAAKEDRKILVEEAIVGREIECAVQGDHVNVIASHVGEILAADEFYSYDAKYNNAESKTILDPVFPEGKEEEVREDAIKIFKALDGFGLSRCDFFLEEGTNDVIFNEINTLPGHTAISMYPMLMGAIGVDITESTTRLINMAFDR